MCGVARLLQDCRKIVARWLQGGCKIVARLLQDWVHTVLLVSSPSSPSSVESSVALTPVESSLTSVESSVALTSAPFVAPPVVE